MGGRKGVDARSVMRGAHRALAGDALHAENSRRAALLTARLPPAALHLQESVPQHAGGCVAPESSDKTGLCTPAVDTPAAVD